MPSSAAEFVAVIGGGPAGLMAAETLATAGIPVAVYEAKPSLGRKFLRAGIGGLNLTHAEDYAAFCTRFADRQSQLQAMLDRFPPSAVRNWAAGLGVETFEGSSGRVFPVGMKAAPLLRAWVHRLRGQGVRFHMRHRWQGWAEDGALRMDTTAGEILLRPRATVLALGGASWPQLGSDGAWVPWLAERDIEVAPLDSANCGFEVNWSGSMRERHAGAQVKPVSLSFTDMEGQEITRLGEFVLTEYGIEGSLVYAMSRGLRELIRQQGEATVYLDLLPGRSAERVLADVDHPRGARSLSSHLQSRVGLKGVKAAMLREVLTKDEFSDLALLARKIKKLPIVLTGTRPLAESISTAGGIRFTAVDEHLMLKKLPGVFVAGEMLDWEAPTGGYLLSACLAQGLWAGEGVHQWLAS